MAVYFSCQRKQIVEGLRSKGHEVTYVAELTAGVSDEEVLSTARSTQAILVTSDKDFLQSSHTLGALRDIRPGTPVADATSCL